MRALGLFCSSSDNLPPVTRELAYALGKACGERGIRLVYGGGARGLMGIAARAARDAGGEVEGYMLEALREREGASTAIGELRFVSTLEERKRAICAAAEAFVALPGGIGTLEELVEQLTWAQLGHHQRPIIIMDIGGFWTPLIELFQHMKSLGFIHSQHRFKYSVCEDVSDVLRLLRAEPEDGAAADDAEPVDVRRL